MLWARVYVGMMVHPIDAFEKIKANRDRISVFPIAVMLVLVMAARIASIYLVHFPVSQLDPRDTNLALEMVKFLVPILSWGIVSFAITSVWDGECIAMECMATAVAGMMPYIVLAVPVALLSRILEVDQKGFFAVANTAMFTWVGLLLFSGMMTMNAYTFRQAVRVGLVCLVSILLFWAVFLLLATLIYQLYHFVQGVLVELQMRALR
jgi:hypothetical protein